jgi:hypothetical protein
MAYGEALGFAFGRRHAITKLEDYELHRVKHLSRAERKEMARIASSREQAGARHASVSS